jgi:putative lipoprotein (rSAM/lipoprotein system)
MKAKFRNLFRTVAGAILGLLGFTGCDLIGGIVNPVCEYGMPTADFKLVGEIKDQDNNPIEGLKVKYRHLNGSWTDEDGQVQEEWIEQEFFTDKDGKVDAAVTNDWSMHSDGIQLEISDVDGEKNGLFSTTVLEGDQLTITKKEDKNSTWHVGTFTVGFAANLFDRLKDMPAEYGMPHADYKVIGNVKDEDGNPIPGIQVLASLWQMDGYDEMVDYPIGTNLSDASGDYTIIGQEWPSQGVKVVFKDIDGENNGGEFQDGEATASWTQVKEPDNRWFEGGFEAKVDVTLKKK